MPPWSLSDSINQNIAKEPLPFGVEVQQPGDIEELCTPRLHLEHEAPVRKSKEVPIRILELEDTCEPVLDVRLILVHTCHEFVEESDLGRPILPSAGDFKFDFFPT